MLKQLTEGPEMCRIWFKVRGGERSVRKISSV